MKRKKPLRRTPFKAKPKKSKMARINPYTGETYEHLKERVARERPLCVFTGKPGSQLHHVFIKEGEAPDSEIDFDWNVILLTPEAHSEMDSYRDLQCGLWLIEYYGREYIESGMSGRKLRAGRTLDQWISAHRAIIARNK